MKTPELPESIVQTMEKTAKRLEHWPKLAELFHNSFPNTLNTTVSLEDDETTFIITGDIPAMWLRDSSAQVHQYISFAKEDPQVRRILEGLIRRQTGLILTDSYANAFNARPDNAGFPEDITEQNPWVWERKYEVDSLANPVLLAWEYWKETGVCTPFDEKFHQAIQVIVRQWRLEQRHEGNSTYTFQRLDVVPSDTLEFQGKGTPVTFTGMTWSGFRPSDDACRYGYLIPANMMAVVALHHIAEMATQLFQHDELAADAKQLAEEIEQGIKTHGVCEHPIFGKIYAYETDGFGHFNLMDDANVPSLLAIPYFGYAAADDPIYQNTRRFILSKENPFYYEGRYAKGIGSPHTPVGYIWPIALVMQALTSEDRDEIRALVSMICDTDAGTGFIHESFNPDQPEHYTRSWFAWANSLFSEMILARIEYLEEK